MIKIPEGLSPEAESEFLLMAEENASLALQIKEAKGVLKGAPLFSKNLTKPSPRENGDTAGMVQSIEGNSIPRIKTPIQSIREFCFICKGGLNGGSKPKKKVRECKETDCPLHPFRMGKNPNMTRC